MNGLIFTPTHEIIRIHSKRTSPKITRYKIIKTQATQGKWNQTKSAQKSSYFVASSRSYLKEKLKTQERRDLPSGKRQNGQLPQSRGEVTVPSRIMTRSRRRDRSSEFGLATATCVLRDSENQIVGGVFSCGCLGWMTTYAKLCCLVRRCSDRWAGD